MKKILLTLAVMAMVAVSCQREVEYINVPKENAKELVTSSATRSYEEALQIAEDALVLLEYEDTRSSKKRVIKRDEGQTVMRPITRGNETIEEPILYIFNNENNEGFTIVAADRSQQPLIAVTEQGSYTYGEPTGVEPFDEYINNTIEVMSLTPTLPPIIDIPNPKPSVYTEYIDIHEEVEPLLSTKWGQGGIYGQFSSNGLAGCTITAIGQIMAYHQHPHYITITHDGSNQNIHLDWVEILKHKSGVTENDSTCLNSTHTIIGKFLREIAYRCGASCDDKGTGLYLYETQPLLSLWGYNRGIYSNASPIFSTIKSNLNNDRPFCITGYDYNNDEEAGHTWVVDGYRYTSVGYVEYSLNLDYNINDPLSGPEYIVTSSNIQTTSLLHYNWGWNGSCDGWFYLHCYDADEAEEFDKSSGNSSRYDFSSYLAFLYNFYPL